MFCWFIILKQKPPSSFQFAPLWFLALSRLSFFNLSTDVCYFVHIDDFLFDFLTLSLRFVLAFVETNTFFLMMNICVFDRFACTISHKVQAHGRVSAIDSVAAAAAAASMQAIGTMENVLF